MWWWYWCGVPKERQYYTVCACLFHVWCPCVNWILWTLPFLWRCILFLHFWYISWSARILDTSVLLMNSPSDFLTGLQLDAEAGIAWYVPESLVEGAGACGWLREWASFIGALTWIMVRTHSPMQQAAAQGAVLNTGAEICHRVDKWSSIRCPGQWSVHKYKESNKSILHNLWTWVSLRVWGWGGFPVLEKIFVPWKMRYPEKCHRTL